MTRLTYIISDIDKALAFEWIAMHLNRQQFDLQFILLNPGDSVLEQFLKQNNIPVTRVLCRGKKDWPAAWWQIYRLLKRQKTEIVHCHLLQANILGLSAAKRAGVPKRIYTRHHSSLHHVYFPKGVWWDKRANRQATHVIAISAAVRNILINWEKLPEQKTVTIPHGFLLNIFHHVSAERVAAFKEKNDITAATPVVGVISRFTIWKGVQYIIPAFKQLLKIYPDAVLLLLNAKGDYAAEIQALLADIPAKNYRTIAFEEDVAAAMHAMDIFVHVPVDDHSEAFGQIYVEALAAGIPSVFTLSGIAPDFIENGENALVVPFKDSDSIYGAMIRILTDEGLKKKLKQEGWNSVKDRFALQQMIHQLENLYGA